MLSYVAAHTSSATQNFPNNVKTFMDAGVKADDTSHGTYCLDILPLSETENNWFIEVS
jgi:hypothetical protein